MQRICERKIEDIHVLRDVCQLSTIQYASSITDADRATGPPELGLKSETSATTFDSATGRLRFLFKLQGAILLQTTHEGNTNAPQRSSWREPLKSEFGHSWQVHHERIDCVKRHPNPNLPLGVSPRLMVLVFENAVASLKVICRAHGRINITEAAAPPDWPVSPFQ